jgi:hemerythrin-like metal-binding protein
VSVPTSATAASSPGWRRHHRRAHGNGPIRVEWIDVFETGNAEIDGIHRELIHDCNRLLMLLDNEASWSLIVDEARRFLERYIEHFRSEESLLERTKFPRYAEHVAEHRRMEYEMRSVVKRMEQVDGSLEEHRALPRSLGPDLIELMIRHDLDYRSHLLHQQGR